MRLGRLALGTSLIALLGTLTVLPPAAAAPGDDQYLQFRQLADDIAKRVVSVQARWTQTQYDSAGKQYETYIVGNTGSGFIYDGEGHVITAYSNISRSPSDFLRPTDPRADDPDHIAEYIRVVFQDRRAYFCDVIGYDTNLDIAVLKMRGIKNAVITPLSLSPEKEFELGQPILTLAYNFLSRDRINVSFGVVSALRSQFPSLEDSANEFIQVAFPKNTGYNGGAVIDLQGRAVAMITSETPYGETLEVHFGVPAPLLADRVEKIITLGYVPKNWFGFNLISINENIRDAYAIPDEIEGMFIVYVEPGSPAASANLRNEDILVEFNGVPIDELDALKNQLELLKIGDTASAVYLRRDFNVWDRFNTTFTLAEKPKDEAGVTHKMPDAPKVTY